MPHARIRIAALLAVALLALGACSSTEAPTPVISNPPAPPAPAALPADWSESVLDVPGADGAATYVAPRNPSRLRAALILGSADKAGEVATRELSVMLAQLGVASLRFDGGPSGADHTTLLGRAGRGLAALAERSGLGDDRLLAIGHGTAAPLALALGAGGTGRQPMPIGLIEPVLTGLPAGTPDTLQAAMALPRLKHNLLTCSDSDIAVDCRATQSLADVMTGTHVNYVRLRGVSHALQEDESRDPARYGTDLPFSASLYRSLGSWVSMQ